MRTNRNLRAPKAAPLAAGALMLALPTSAVAFGVDPADAIPASSATPTPVRAAVDRTHVGYDRAVVVRGDAPSADAGRSVALQFEPAGGHVWRTLTVGRIGRQGQFALRGHLRRTGLLRVADAPAASAAATRSRSTARPAAAPLTPSSAQLVEVGSRFALTHAPHPGIAGQHGAIKGTLLPGTAGRVVRLLIRQGRGWATLAKSRTGRHGGFTLRYVARGTGSRWLRVAFAGDRTNRATVANAGELVGMRYTVASWYDDAGNTACGFHATYGVANKTLPCGTKVTFAYGGRTVTATVDDRGPYVAGREYDLNQNTAGALGMGGVATVESSV